MFQSQEKRDEPQKIYMNVSVYKEIRTEGGREGRTATSGRL